VTGFLTQGRGDGHEWVTSFMVSYSVDGFQWQYVIDMYGNQMVSNYEISGYCHTCRRVNNGFLLF